MPLDQSTIGIDRQYSEYFASCWKCDRMKVPVDMSQVPAHKLVTKLRPRCKHCGSIGRWAIVPKCTLGMLPRPDKSDV